MIPHDPDEQTSDRAAERTDEPQEPGQALVRAREQADEYLNNWKRAQADFLNYKRRTEQERLETGKYAASQLILALLPVLDDYDRALDSVPPPDANRDWLQGVKLIATKLRAILQSRGLAPIEAVGAPFDPSLHEAVMHSPGEDGVVVKELTKGYKLYDKVLRPSQVIVGNGETD